MKRVILRMEQWLSAWSLAASMSCGQIIMSSCSSEYLQ
jgi:hypothetical protein